jgi:uncharacterized protein YeaO (DUF488 family)
MLLYFSPINTRIRSNHAARNKPDTKTRDGETMIKVKSIFAPHSDDDGFRVLVEPVWPRKASRGKNLVNVWLRDLAPSQGLYNLYTGNMIPWEGFIARYHEELNMNRDYFPDLQRHNDNGGLTLVHGSISEERNIAVALKRLLEKDHALL